MDIYANALFVKYFFIKGKAYSQFYLPTSRAWEILLGVFCSFYTFRYNIDINKQFRNLIVAAGLCMILLSFIFVEGSENFSNKIILISTLGTCMLLIFINQDTIFFKFLSNKLLVFRKLL